MEERSAELAKSAINGVLECLAANLQRRINPSVRPEFLYHFTDAGGVAGIVSSKKLRASHATACNDASETLYAIEKLIAVLQGSKAVPTEFREMVAEFARKPDALPSFVVKLDPYIIFFCEHVESSAQWLHYGRQGRGFALKFDSKIIQKKPFDLVRVTYAEDDQARFIDDLVAEAFGCLEKKLVSIPKEHHLVISGTAAHAVAQYATAASPHLKHPAFSTEAEWRLITYETKHPAAAHLPPLPVFFRQAGARIVPYVEMEFDPAAIKEIVVGHSNPMLQGEQALEILWREHLVGEPKYIRSRIPVRE